MQRSMRSSRAKSPLTGSLEVADKKGKGRATSPSEGPLALPDMGSSARANWLTIVERTITGMGYELVDAERGTNGLLRVYIDRLPGQVYATGAGDHITVDDCEVITRQLQYVLEVENCDYSRLEVSSPGLDRPLKKMADFIRFAGQEIEVTLKNLFQGRKKYRGLLEVDENVGALRLIFNDGRQDQVLGFTLDEIREARLVPVVSFKKTRVNDSALASGQENDMKTGGREE